MIFSSTAYLGALLSLFMLGSALPTDTDCSSSPLGSSAASLISLSNELASIVTLLDTSTITKRQTGPGLPGFPAACQSECTGFTEVFNRCLDLDRSGCLQVCSTDGWNNAASCLNCDLQFEVTSEEVYNELQAAINKLAGQCRSITRNDVPQLQLIPYTSLTGYYSTLSSIPTAAPSFISNSLAPSQSLIVATTTAAQSQNTSPPSAMPSAVHSASQASPRAVASGVLGAGVLMMTFFL